MTTSDCPICYETCYNDNFINCDNNHIACCLDCFSILPNTNCPICRNSLSTKSETTTRSQEERERLLQEEITRLQEQLRIAQEERERLLLEERTRLQEQLRILREETERLLLEERTRLQEERERLLHIEREGMGNWVEY